MYRLVVVSADILEISEYILEVVVSHSHEAHAIDNECGCEQGCGPHSWWSGVNRAARQYNYQQYELMVEPKDTIITLVDAQLCP